MLQGLMTRIGRVLRALFGLALMAGALAIGLIVAAGLLIRLAWRRRGREPMRPVSARQRRPDPAGEVVDAEVREVREVGVRQVPHTASGNSVA